VEELERRARLCGWFLTTHEVGEQMFWQWRPVADPEDGRHPIFRSDDEARDWMASALDRGVFRPGDTP
jgi:hypothetical protein